MRLFKKMVNKIVNPEKQKKLVQWQERFENAKQQYANELKEMAEQENLYRGDRAVNINPNKGNGKSAKVSVNVRNICYELIETEVDSSVPMPKVTPIHEEDEYLANIIEKMLQNEVQKLRLNVLNDVSERVVPVQGGDFMHVEWDNTKGYHCTIGDVAVNERHPRSVIPQPGVTSIEDMDYIFIMVAQTKDFVKRKYNVDVKDASDSEVDFRESEGRSNQEDIVTVVQCYYRNPEGKIGLFSWCDDYVLEDMEDYQARRLTRCKKCGRIKVGDVCECGSKSFETKIEEEEELTEDIIKIDGSKILSETEENVPVLDEDGNPTFDEAGLPIEEVKTKKVKIPYYKPNEFPLILRRNVSRAGKLLGTSDVAVIEDQQDAIKKLGSKMQEKILKGGSIVTLPAQAKIDTTDEELKVVKLRSPNDKALIDVLNIQADITMDRIMLSENYEWARSTLGITDSYQGKYDSSATSGTAKQYSINQAAGRLESKRVMKNVAYADLYRLIFKFMLAYADQPIPLSGKDENGKATFSHFNRYDFLKMDAAGEFYWDDEFIFGTDPTSTIMMNREALWQMIDLKYQAGAFGPIGDPNTLLKYWTFLEKNDYPNSSEIKEMYVKEVEQQKMMQQIAMMQQQLAQAQANPQMGGMENVMPQM